MILAALRDDSYNVVLVIHIVSVIVAFAPVIAGLLQQGALRSDLGGEVARRLAGVQGKVLQTVSMGSMVLVLVTGLGMIFMSDLGNGERAIEFSDAAISIAFVLWFVIAGLISGMVGKGERQKSEGDVKGADLVQWGSAIALALAVVATYLMVFEIPA